MLKPQKICPYAGDCYRKNPIHFKEFSHPHLENILSKGVDPNTNKYSIPDEYFLTKDTILIQLKLLEKLYISAPPSKVETEATNTNPVKPKEPEPILSKESGTAKRQNTQPKPSTSQVNDESHLPKKPKVDKNIHDYIQVVLPKGQMARKLKNAAPYNFFLTTITDSKPTHNEPLSITLQEILDESLGEIESSVQINFMVDVGWLLGHYYFAGCLDTPLLILYGDDTPELRTISEKKPQVTAIKVQMSSPFATHHTKMMLLGYKDGSIRVVISTANLYEDDWHNRTQGIWLSPKLNALPDGVDTESGESPTGFRHDLMLYLVQYKISKLQPWIARIRKTDFSEVNVFLVASVPGGFRETPKGHPWGHARLGSLLSKHSFPIDETIPIVAQSSSIGSLGPNVQSWILSDIVNSLRKDSAPLGIRRVPPFKMIYPSFENVKNSHDGMLGGGCLPYSKKVNDKQPWLKEHLYQWKAKDRHRLQAMPHIKTYCRWSDKGLYWFVLTSANLSKAAWGAFNKSAKIEPVFRINNYEAGVLFLPKFVIGKDLFPMKGFKDEDPPFPIPYDIPLTPYGRDDTPFVMDYLMSMGM